MGTLDQFLQDIQGRVPELQKQSDAMKKGMLLDEANLERLREKIVAMSQVSHEEKELIRRKSLLEKDMQSIGNLTLPEFNYKEPFKGFSHEKVHGFVYSLFTVPEVNKEWFEALELAGGGKLYNVIVETEREASALLENGGLKKRVTILPLNKIQGYRIPRDKVERMKKAVGTNAFLALDLIKYDSSMTPALEYVFGSTILCRNKETAALLAYDKSAGFNMKCITMDGDVYDPSGTLTGGSSTKSGLSADGLLELKSKHDQRKFIENELGSLNESLSKLQDPRSSSAEIERQIELLVHSISLKKKQLISDISVTALNSYQSQQRELADLIAFQDDLTSRIRASMSKIEGYKRDNSEYLNCRDKETKLVDLEKKIQMIKGNELPKLEKLFQKFKFQKDNKFSVHFIQCDNLGENLSFQRNVQEDKALSIKFELTAPYTPEQNGMVDRKYATL